MKVGDLVQVKSKSLPGTLTAVKYFQRIYNRTGDMPGVIIQDHGKNVQVVFGNTIIVLNKVYLEVINESR